MYFKIYYYKIKRNLPYSRQASSLINDLKFSITGYTDNHPSFTFQEIIDIFGIPEEITESFILSLNSAEYKKMYWLKKLFLLELFHLFYCFYSFIQLHR